ncbi:MAG: serine--tRNA ligase [Hyphomicrobiaceae bacterium]|nr:serine--tRNA ligase [Hyphomicrobiaceae bacterium]
MLDIKWICENPDSFDKSLKARGLEPMSKHFVEMYEARRFHLTKLQTYQSRRNELSNKIGKAKAAGDEEAAKKLIAEVTEIKDLIAAGEQIEREIDKKLIADLAVIPNIPLDEIPVGKSESDNLLVRTYGKPPEFDFNPKEHFEIGEALGLMDFEKAAKMSGARFVVLSGVLARLERVLAQFMLDVHTDEFGYTEINPPLLVREHAAFGTANLPKFSEALFRTEQGYWLIPTAEVTLTNLARETIYAEVDLPRRYVAWTPCFRSEAGSAGRDVRGMIRQHQFSKVELVSIVTQKQAIYEHERMTNCAEEILKRLGLPFRTTLLCTGDLGFASSKTYDIEVWLPGQNTYREISSCSLCGDFQARRMFARYREDNNKHLRYCTTLNGSGLALGRTLIAILENYQKVDGSVELPEVLHSYMNGTTEIVSHFEVNS